jgi:hypothetical protein
MVNYPPIGNLRGLPSAGIVARLVENFIERENEENLRQLVLAAMYTELLDPNITRDLENAISYPEVMEYLKKKYTPSKIVLTVVELYLNEFKTNPETAKKFLNGAVSIGNPTELHIYIQNVRNGMDPPDHVWNPYPP